MQLDDLDRWRDSFEAFHARFAHLFVRSESREQVAKYLRGLLALVERNNGWQVAEAVGDATPDRMQRLLYRVDWDADAARDGLQRFVIGAFGAPGGRRGPGGAGGAHSPTRGPPGPAGAAPPQPPAGPPRRAPPRPWPPSWPVGRPRSG